MAIRPGISPSARRSSLRPHSASPRSATLYGTRPAAWAASYACIFSLRTVAITSPSLLIQRRRFHAYRRKQRRPLRVGIRRQHPHSDVGKPRAGEKPFDLLVRETEPHVAHLLLVLLPVVRQHIDDEHATAGTKRAPDLRQRPGRRWRVMQDQRQHRGVQLAILDRKALELALPQIDVACPAQPLARRLEHVVRAVDRDHLADVRRHSFRELAGATAQVADDERRVDQAEDAPEKKGVAEELAAEPIPPAGGGREELLRFGAPPRQHAAQPPIVLPGP